MNHTKTIKTAKVIIIVIVLAMAALVAFWANSKAKKAKATEPFYPAWHDFQIYSQLSRRVKVGMVGGGPGWAFEGLNVDIVLFANDKDVLYNLLVTKSVDVAVSSEAQYGCYILGQLPEHITKSKEQILANKRIILQNNNTRRLFTLGTIYHLLVANYNTFAKMADSEGKIVQVGNLADATHQLDLALLPPRCRVMYADKPDVSHWRSDAYFYDYHAGTAAAAPPPFYDDRNNSTLLDCAGPIPDKYFFMRKDELSLDATATANARVLQRRRQTIDFFQLPLKPAAVQCYSHKMLLLTRADVPDEWIFLFNKSLGGGGKGSSSSLSLQSTLDPFLPLHKTLQS
jgi:hypothetical protein